MKQLLMLLAILVICIAVILKLALPVDVDTAAITSVIIVTALVIAWIWYYNCTRRGRIAARAMAIKKNREERILYEIRKERTKMSRKERLRWEREYDREQRRHERHRLKVGTSTDGDDGIIIPNGGRGFGC